MDLRSCLEGWPYEAGRNIRVGRGVNGREIIWVRQPLGLEQYEADGRPDGRRMQGMDTALDFHLARLHTVRPAQAAGLLALTPEDCAELFDEAAIFHDRLMVLFRLKDWPRAERDAALILRLLDSVRQHACCAGDRLHLEPWRSHIQRIYAAARAMNLLAQGRGWGFPAVRDQAGLPDTGDDGAADQAMIGDILLQSVRDLVTAPPALRPPDESLFLHQNDHWKIQYQGRLALLKHMRGFPCLACLLRSPGREFHVSELLVSLLDAPAPVPPMAAPERLGPPRGVRLTTGLPDGLPMLDAQAKREYQRRLQELRQELAEAEEFNDPDRAAQSQTELNEIARQLASAIGLGGRDRKSSSAAERARCAGTKRLKKAIQKIGEAIPTLGHHLATSIKTGYFCTYHPDPGHLIDWKF